MRLGDIAPDFKAACYFPFESEKKEIEFSEFCADNWVILFSHPADFTPVCTTELARVNSLENEWKVRGCKVIGLSTDTIQNHSDWSKDICEYGRSTEKSESVSSSSSSFSSLNFPIIADHNLAVSQLYGMLDQESHDPGNFDPKTRAPLPIRTVFVMDPRRKIRLMMTYPAAVGRNFDEILRALDALQRSDTYKIATPADWKVSDEVIVRFDVGEEEAAVLFPNRRHFNEYLRFTPDPKN